MTDIDRTSPLAAYLRDRDIPCPVCGVSLRNLTTTKCPACREELQLSLTLSDPKIKLWLTCALPLLLCAGVGCFVLLGIARRGFHVSNSPDMIIGLGFLATVPLGLASLAFRRRFNRLPRTTRVILAVLSLSLPLVLFSALSSLI